METEADVGDIDEALEGFWRRAVFRAKLNHVPSYFGPTPLEVVRPPAWAFGTTADEADGFLRDVLSGRTTAIAGSLRDYRADDGVVPEIGELGIVVDGRRHPGRAGRGDRGADGAVRRGRRGDHRRARAPGSPPTRPWSCSGSGCSTPREPARPGPPGTTRVTDMDAQPRTTYLLIDGENLDATLGGSILGRRPQPEERPRWNRVLDHVEEAWGQPVRGLFFLAVAGDLPAPFVQAVMAIGYRPIPLQGDGKVVDIAIQRTLDAIRDRDADVVLGSHDGDFLPQLTALADGRRRIGLIGFQEFVNAGFREVPHLEMMDLEHDVGAFNTRLPRVRVIPIDEFDPLEFL